MIPKIIHFCWLSDDPFPADVKRYMDTWRRFLPDYEFRHWNFSRFPKSKSKWVEEAYDRRKYAFAADYIRCYALYNEGGIYFDCDIEVLKNFDRLLGLPYFFGYENGSGCIEAALMGSEPGNPIFKHLLDYYDTHPFVKSDGTLDTMTLPQRIMSAIEHNGYEVADIVSPTDFVKGEKMVSVLPHYYFSPIHHEHKRLESTPETMAIHRFAGSWTSPKHKLKRRIKMIVGPDLTEWFIKTKRRILRKQKK